jgi:leucyl aminopeptidase
MKIDVVRRLPETPDTVVLYQREEGKIDVFAELLSDTMHEALTNYVKTESFYFKAGEIHTFNFVNKAQHVKFILCGMGKPESLTPDKVRRTFAEIIRAAIKLKSKQIYLIPGFDVPLTDAMLGQVMTEAAMLSIYKFDKYISDSKYVAPEVMHFVYDFKNTRNVNKGILEGRILSETTNLARDLVNEPANVINPETLAEAAKKAALQYGFSIDVYTIEKLRRIKMDAFLAVGRGSKIEPRLIIIRHHGNPEGKHDTIGLIGKGLTYDSGGYSIKPTAGMVNMKSDMAGAAAVIGAMSAIATLKLKVNVVAIIATCENMISGDAYRPGDIVRSMSGKTIEVLNTDAEGRLTLIDAIHYAIEREHVSKIIDIATLTGAALAALGGSITAVVTNDQDWYACLDAAAKTTGETIWQLPNFEEYKELIKSEIADLKNIGGQWAGAITAAQFIQEFVQGLPWMHLDIAGTSGRDKASGYNGIGATGVGVRLLTTLLKSME